MKANDETLSLAAVFGISNSFWVSMQPGCWASVSHLEDGEDRSSSLWAVVQLERVNTQHSAALAARGPAGLGQALLHPGLTYFSLRPLSRE